MSILFFKNMKTNKKLKLNTKKVVILSNDQQNAVQGGGSIRFCIQNTHYNLCGPTTTFGGDCGGSNIGCGEPTIGYACTESC